jgi:hypothetical protein
MINASLIVLALLHGGEDRMDFIYFLSAVFMVLLPLTIFSTLTWLMVKAYRKRERSQHFPH